MASLSSIWGPVWGRIKAGLGIQVDEESDRTQVVSIKLDQTQPNGLELTSEGLRSNPDYDALVLRQQLADTSDPDNGAAMIGFRQPGGVEQSVYSVLHRGFLAPEQFYLESDGDNWAPAMQRCANAAENYQLAVITLTPGKTYIMDDQVVIKHNSIWNCYGSKLYMRSNPELRGGFIRAQGTGTTIGTGWTERNNIVINGMTAEIDPSVKGVNCFNTTVSHGVIHRDCVAIGATWGNPSDPKPQGGRGFTCHTRTRRANFINCRAYRCDIGFHILDKSDTDYTLTPNLSPQFVPGVVTVGTVPAGHWLTVGDRVSAERYTGNWAALNGNTYTVIDVSATTVTLYVDTSTFGVHDGLGRISRADTGEFRTYSVDFQNCEAEECSISAIMYEQVQQSRDVFEPRNVNFTGRIKNCGTAYPASQGVISLGGVPGIRVDVTIYQDAAHPCGAIIRGATMQSDVRVRGYVHTCSRFLDYTPMNSDAVGLDEGSPLHPGGTNRANNYKLTIESDTVQNYFVYVSASQVGMTDNQHYAWQNNVEIQYNVGTLPATLVHFRAQHASNNYLLTDLSTGQNTVIGAGGVAGLGVRVVSNIGDIPIVDGLGNSVARLQYTSADSRWLVKSGSTTYFKFTPTTLQPGADNTYKLGTGALRYTTVYAATGAINTSDGREKTSVSPITANEIAAARELASEIGTYQWLSAVESKGPELARTHVGLTVQRAIQIMESHGLDPFKYGFICFDAWEESIEDMGEGNSIVIPAGDRYSFRMDELIAFMVCGLSAHLDSLSARLDALDSSS